MKTIALWCDKYQTSNSEEAKKEIDIHINFWKIVKRKKNFEYFVDLGFMIHDANSIDRLNIHFPFDVDKANVEDIGQMMRGDHKIVNAIFNENYGISNSPDHSKHTSVKDTKDNEIFSIYSIDFESDDVKFLKCYHGTNLSIKIPNSSAPANKIYLRIRLKGNSIKYFICEFAPKNWFFQSAFTSTDAIDFRINEKRNFNRSLAEAIREDQLFKIRKVHFLLMRNAQDDLIADHLKINCRELEVDLWQDYVGSEYIVNNIVAYHWSEKAVLGENKYLESFNTWVKVKYHKSNLKTIILYVIVIGVLSITFNLLSSVISEKLLHIGDSTKTNDISTVIKTDPEQEIKNISEASETLKIIEKVDEVQ